jgi:hypothetical protein
MQARIATVVAVITALVPAAADGAAKRTPRPALRSVAAVDAQGVVVGDGRRFLAYQATPGFTTVIDDVDDAAITVADPPGCRLAAVGGAKVMWSCPVPAGSGSAAGFNSSFDYPVVLDLDSSERFTPDGQYLSLGEMGRRVEAVGRYWITGRFQGTKNSSPFTIDMSGRFAGGPGPGARSIADLDEPGLLRGLCAGLIKPRSTFIYSPPYAVNTPSSTPIRVQRCGHKPPITVGVCHFCTSVGLAAGTVTWLENGTLHAFVIDRRIKWIWPVPGTFQALQTRRGVYVRMGNHLLRARL